MKRALLLFCFLTITTQKYLGITDNGIPIFSIDLDLPLSERFRETALYFKDQVLE